MYRVMNVWLAASVVALIVGACVLPARADLITNGSFETPQLTTPYPPTYKTSLSGWTITNGIVLANEAYSSFSAQSDTAEDGTQWRN